MMVTLTMIENCIPIQFHMPRRQPYFIPADIEDSAPGPGEKQSRMVATKKVSQVAIVMKDFAVRGARFLNVEAL